MNMERISSQYERATVWRCSGKGTKTKTNEWERKNNKRKKMVKNSINNRKEKNNFHNIHEFNHLIKSCSCGGYVFHFSLSLWLNVMPVCVCVWLHGLVDVYVSVCLLLWRIHSEQLDLYINIRFFLLVSIFWADSPHTHTLALSHKQTSTLSLISLMCVIIVYFSTL